MVWHPDLDVSAAVRLNFPEELSVDKRAVRAKGEATQHVGPYDLQRAVDVLDLNLKREEHKAVEDTADHRTKRGILTAGPPPGDHLCIGEQRCEQSQVRHVELPVGIRERRVLEIGCAQAVADGGAVPLSSVVTDHAQ